MLSFIKNSALGILSVFIRLASSFIFNKMVALYYGPAGLAQLAYFQNLLSLLTTIQNDGINRGTIKYLAGKYPGSEDYFTYLKTAFYLSLFIYFISAFLIVGAHKYVLAYFPWTGNWLLLFISGAFFIVLQSFFNALLLARQKTFQLVLGNAVFAMLLIGFIFLAKSWISLPYLLIGYVLVSGLMIIYYLPVSIKGISYKQLFKTSFSKIAASNLSKFILMSVSVLVFSKGLDYYIRTYMLHHFSVYQTGLWQGVVKVSDSYTAIFTAVLAIAFYPKVALLSKNTQGLQSFVRFVIGLVVPVLVLGLGTIYVFREQALTIILSGKFLKAEIFFPYQLTGDFFKLLSWLLANILVAQANFRVIFFFEAFSAIAYLVYFHFFTSQFGITGSVMAYCANYFTFLVLNLIYFRKLLFK